MKIGKKYVYSGDTVASGFGKALISGDVVVNVCKLDDFAHVVIVGGDAFLFRVHKNSLKKYKKNKDVDAQTLADKKMADVTERFGIWFSEVYCSGAKAEPPKNLSAEDQIHSALSEVAAELQIPVSMITGENTDEETVKAFNDAISDLHATRPSNQTKTPMMDFLNSGAVKTMTNSKGEYRIIDASDNLDSSRLFIHYIKESEGSSEFVCECNSVAAANIIVAALAAFNDEIFTGSEG